MIKEAETQTQEVEQTLSGGQEALKEYKYDEAINICMKVTLLLIIINRCSRQTTRMGRLMECWCLYLVNLDTRMIWLSRLDVSCVI